MESYSTCPLVPGCFHRTWSWGAIRLVSSCASFLLITVWYSVVWIYPKLLVHSTVDGHLCCSQFGAISNIHKQVSKCRWARISLGVYLGGVLLDHGGRCMFNCKRYCQVVFQSRRATLTSHRHHRRVPIALHFCQFLVLSKRTILANLTGEPRDSVLSHCDFNFSFPCYWWDSVPFYTLIVHWNMLVVKCLFSTHF